MRSQLYGQEGGMGVSHGGSEGMDRIRGEGGRKGGGLEQLTQEPNQHPHI